MKKILHPVVFILLLFFSIFFSGTNGALAQTTCAIDRTLTAGGITYPACPFGETNNFLLGAGFNSARLETNVSNSQTPLFVHKGVPLY